MTKRDHRWIVAGMALAVLVAGMPLEAMAKREKPFVSATLNGKRFKARGVRALLTAGGGTIGFSVLGQKVGRSGKLLYVACAVLFNGQPLPFTSTDCSGSYTETKGLRPPTMTIWNDLRAKMTSVTFEAYDGTRIAGTFHTVLQGFSSPDLAPLTIDGEFHGPFEAGDPTR